MQVISKIVISTALSLLAISAYAATSTMTNTTSTQASKSADASSGMDISGTYQCQGYDPFGKSDYNYPTATFSKNGDTYNVQWQSSTGYPLLLGTGLFNKDITNAFSVVFWDPKKADYFGTALYLVKPDGSLAGVWTLQAQKQVGTETCTKAKS